VERLKNRAQFPQMVKDAGKDSRTQRGHEWTDKR